MLALRVTSLSEQAKIASLQEEDEEARNTARNMGIGTVFGVLIAVFGLFIAIVGFIFYFQESADKTLSLTMIVFGVILFVMYYIGDWIANSIRSGS